MLFIILIFFLVLAFRDFPVIATFIPHSRAPARQGEIISGLHLCSSPLYKGKKSGAFQEKMKISSQSENHRLLRFHGLGPSANNERNERTEERSLPEKKILFSLLPSFRGNRRRHACHYKPVLLRRQGGDDFLEARIAAQRIPEWRQL